MNFAVNGSKVAYKYIKIVLDQCFGKLYNLH